MHKKNLLLLLSLTLPAWWYLLRPGYFSMHDDLQIMRLFQMDKCLTDGQIPCRYSPDMVWGYGQAMFNYYSAFPYYLGTVFTKFFLSYIMAAKLLFLLALMGAGIGMYLLAREFWGEKGALFSALLYVYAPYHALDIYVRGALAESFALMLLPFVWHGFYLLSQKRRWKYLLYTSIAFGLMLMTHNISLVLAAPFTALWVIYLLFKAKNARLLIDYMFVGAISLSLASFFILPAFFERNLIQANLFINNYYDFHAHFLSLRQLFFERTWGFGGSVFGPQDGMSFQIGWVHTASCLLAALVSWRLWKQAKAKFFLVWFLLIMLAGATFMTHGRSNFVWEAFPLLEFVQFPWRFLGLSIFFVSLLGGSLFALKMPRFLLPVLIFLLVALNYNYFRGEHYYSHETDATKLTGKNLVEQKMAAVLDYLPQTAATNPKAMAPSHALVLRGEAETLNFSKKSNYFFFDAKVYQAAQIAVPVIYFPGWTVYSEDQRLEIIPTPDLGLVSVNLEPGTYMIRGFFEETPFRVFCNMLTALTSIFLLLATIWVQEKKRFLWYQK